MFLKLLNILISVPFSNLRIGLKLTLKGGSCGALQLEGHPTSRQSFWRPIM